MQAHHPRTAPTGGGPLPFIIEHRILALALLGLLLYVAFLGFHDLWYPDELDIAEVARAMNLSGDWISPRRMGVIWVDYPPMIYWAGVLSSHLLGDMTPFSLRLPNGLAAVATALVTCAAASRWFGARAGFWAGLALLTFQYFVYQGNSYRPDVLFTLTITAGMVLYAQGAGANPRWYLRAIGFAFLGLAMLSKGPLGLLLPGLVLTLWHGTRRRWWLLLELAPLALISIAIYWAWFAANAQAMGWNSILYELYAQNLERFLDASTRGHQNPFFYYFRNIWVDLHPWSWLLPVAIWWLVRSQRWRDPNVQLALWWVGAFMLFLSFAETKRQLYLLPAYPAAALLLGPWLASVGGGAAEPDDRAPSPRPVRIYLPVVSVAYTVLGAALLFIVARYADFVAALHLKEHHLEVARLAQVPFAVVGLVALSSGVWIGLAWWRKRDRSGLRRVVAAHVAIYVALLSLVLPAMEPAKSYAPQSEWIREQIGASTHFGMVYPPGSKASDGTGRSSGVARRGGLAYHTGAMVDLLNSREEVEAFFRKYPDSIVLIHEGSVDRIFSGHEAQWRARVIGTLRTGVHVFTVVRGPQGEQRRAGPAPQDPG